MKNQYVLEEQNGIHNLYNITIQKVWDSVLNYYTYGKKKKENVTYTQEEKQSMKTNPKMTQMLKLADKDFKAAYFYAQGHRGKYTCNE